MNIENYLNRTLIAINSIRSVKSQFDQACEICIAAIRNGNKVIFCGNGGSAADSQHLAAELMGRFLKDRDPMAALALTVDTSAITAIGNDYGYEHIFSRQLRGIGRPGDVLVGISTSGNSKNVVNAFEVAQTMGIKTVAMTGKNGGAMSSCDVLLNVDSTMTNHIQEAHITMGHMLCACIEEELCK
jgi:D-sedoheptulose 7-phosphate isomerase